MSTYDVAETTSTAEATMTAEAGPSVDVLDDVDLKRLADLCRQYGIATLLVFGSAVRDQQRADSDLDLLYDLMPGARLGWEIDDLSDALAEVFGRPVDLVSRRALHPRLRSAVLEEARPVYAA